MAESLVQADHTNCHDDKDAPSEHGQQAKKVEDSATNLDETDDDDHLEVFKPLLARMQVEHIPSFASAVRAAEETTIDPWKCTVLDPALYGSYHILHPIQFQDGRSWLLKIPATGYPGRFDEIGARSLVSEAETIRMLKRETTIPIPRVLRYDPTFDNQLNCPYILMERVNGVPLSELWFDHKVTEDVLEQRRRIALKDIAASMAELDKYTFSTGGRPVFTEDKESVFIGTMKRTDSWAELARLETESTDLTGIFCDLGPFKNAKDFFLAMLDRHKLSPASDLYSVGIDKLLRRLIDWAPLEIDRIEAFALAHPDFDIQNFLVSPEGWLCGIIDWDGVAAVPRCIGNRSLPGWLTRDWDPAIYWWGMEGDVKENSPEELARYRDIYVEAMAEHGGDPRMTRNTLVLENLYIAATDPRCQHGIVDKIFSEITRLVAPETLTEDNLLLGDGADLGSLKPGDNEDEVEEEDRDDDMFDLHSTFYLYEVANALVVGSLDDGRLQLMKEGFFGLFK